MPVSAGSISVFHSLTQSTRYQGQDGHYPQCKAGENTTLIARLSVCLRRRSPSPDPEERPQGPRRQQQICVAVRPTPECVGQAWSSEGPADSQGLEQTR